MAERMLRRGGRLKETPMSHDPEEDLHLRRDAARRQPRHPPPVQRRAGAADRQGARRGQGRFDRGRPRRRPAGRQLQLRLRRPHRPRVDRGGGQRRQAREDRHAAAAGHRHRPRPEGRLRGRRAHRARRDALHRGRHLAAAHRVRAPSRHGSRGLPDDEPHDHAAGAGAAGQADGELRRDLLLRGRLGRRARA